MEDPWEIVRSFERSLAEYCGAPYAVALDSGYAAIFLSLKFVEADEVWLPYHTHISVASAAIHVGATILWTGEDWQEIGQYILRPFQIIDSACLLQPKMYEVNSLTCLSFDYTKHLPIGRGGAILCNHEEAYDWLKKARFYGRPEETLADAGPDFVGWKMHMDPERAARGLMLLHSLEGYEPAPLYFDYPDLRQFEAINRRAK